MKYITLIFALFPALLFSQNNAVKGGGVIYTSGPPTLSIDPRFHAELAIDTASGLWWEYSRDLGWMKAGFRIQDVSGCTPPAYTPQDKQSEIVRNACDSLYGWRSGAWRHLNPRYTAGTGISITGNTISNTGDLSNTNEIQTLSASGTGPTQYNIDLSNSGGSVTLKEGANVDLTRTGNEITIAASDQYQGTVTSVNLTAPTAELDVSGVPITGSGTIALSWDNQLRNLIFASPTASTGQPSFRALNYLDFNPALKDSLDIIVIRNVSEFLTYPKNSSNRHKVLFWDDADRGGVFVLRTTGSANGGTIFQGNGASSKWHRITPDGRTNVKWFGATGNGSTDDLSAMQAAANYVGNNNGHLYFPAGTYITSATVTLDSFSNVVVSGDGPNLSILKRKSNTVGTVNRVLRIDGAGGDVVTVMNIGFDGNSANQTAPSPSTQWQQYHNLYILSSGANAFKSITIQNVNSYNPLGDGISLAGGGSDGFGLANIVNVYEENRLYTRSSITVTANFDAVNITNFTGPVVEVEPNGFSGSYKYNLNLTNVHCTSELDLNLLGARAAGRKGVCNANGLYLKGSLVSLGEFDFNVSNFYFRTTTAMRMAYGSYRMTNGIIYADSAFVDTYLLTEASANPTDTAVFNSVQFSRHPSVTGLSAYFVDDNAAGAQTLVAFNNCQFNNGTRSATIRAGRFEFVNCTHTLTDTTTACIYTNGSTTKSGVASYVVIRDNYLPDYAYLFRPSISGTGQKFLVEGGNARDGHRILWDRFDKIDVEALPQNLQRYDENTATSLNASGFPKQGRWRKGDRLYYRDPASKGAEWAECTVSGRADGVSATGATSGASFKKSGLHAVNTTGATAGQVLKWNGSLWVPANDSIGGGSGGGGIYGNGTPGSGSDTLPAGGSTVTTNNYPLEFQTATAAGLVSNVIQVSVPYSADDAFTNYLAAYTPIDSFKIFNFDGATYVKSFSGNLNLESDEIALITADSVQVSTVASSTKIPAMLGITPGGTLKKITASTTDHVLKWDGSGWVTGAASGGGGVTGTGTANYVTYWTGTTTIAADADFQFDGTRVGIQGAPVSGFSLYTANAVRFDGTAVIRGSGDNFTSSTATPHFRLWNTTASTGDTWYIGSENDGELSITSSNLGGIMAKFTANGDYQLTNALEMKVDAAPPSAPADGFSMYAIERANVQTPAWVDESGQAWEVMASFFGSKWAMWSANGNGTGVSTWTLANSESGTATTRNVASTNLFTSMRRIGYVTAASGSSVAGTRHNNQQFWRGNAAGLGGFVACFRFGFSTANTTNKQAFVGLRASTAAISGNTNPSSLTNIIGFGIDATQTTLRWMVNDGSGTATTSNLGASFPSNTTDADMYDARIFATPNGGTVYYWIKNLSTGQITSGSSTTDLPSTTTFLCPVLWIGNGTDATAVGIDIVQYGILTLN